MIAFIHIHKTGGTTLQWILRSTLGASYCEVEPLTIERDFQQIPWMAPARIADLEYMESMYPQLGGIGGHHIQPHMQLHEKYPGLKYFTFMRDPVKMRASMYQHGVNTLGEENCVFEEWLQEEQSRNRQTKMIAGTADVNKAIEIIEQQQIFVGLTEHFNESLLLLKNLVDSNLNIAYKRMNVAKGETAAKRLLASEEARAQLQAGNEADMALYEFVKQEWYPRFQQAYGRSLAEDVADYQAKLSQFGHRQVSLSFMSKPRLFKLLLLLDMEPYNGRNVTLSLLKKYLLYRSKIQLDRKRLQN
ncbi:MAG: hypothetical protein H6657_04395 [Ardenticatenaceae bacterium]|nr:hypothetical protein [Ardenticatenaceae bacterium]